MSNGKYVLAFNPFWVNVGQFPSLLQAPIHMASLHTKSTIPHIALLVIKPFFTCGKTSQNQPFVLPLNTAKTYYNKIIAENQTGRPGRHTDRPDR